jgi:histidinol-phosphate phosphatase family protein
MRNVSESSNEKWNGVVWLDRDGTLVDDPGYLSDPAGLKLLPHSARAVAKLNEAGLCVVLITNQSGIARGLMSRGTVDRIHEKLRAELARAGAHLDGIYLCPHLPAEELKEGQQACACRKPRTGLVERATRELQLEALPAVVVGDKSSDMELARRIASRSVLVLTGEGRATRRALEASRIEVDRVSENLDGAVEWILRALERGE